MIPLHYIHLINCTYVLPLTVFRKQLEEMPLTANTAKNTYIEYSLEVSLFKCEYWLPVTLQPLCVCNVCCFKMLKRLDNRSLSFTIYRQPLPTRSMTTFPPDYLVFGKNKLDKIICCFEAFCPVTRPCLYPLWGSSWLCSILTHPVWCMSPFWGCRSLKKSGLTEPSAGVIPSEHIQMRI